MRISTKCSIALHILLLLGAFPDRKLTSELIARSAGCNPVVVRNLLGGLKRAGIVEVHRGTGGAVLAADPGEVTVRAVFQAVDDASLDELVGLHPNPNPMCPVGANIYALLEKPYGRVADSVRSAMESYTLRQLIDDYAQRAGDSHAAFEPLQDD